MRTKKFLKHLILGALLLATENVVGQTTVVGNSGGVTDFLGWDNTATNNFPLMVRHDLNQPIAWYTDSLQRMQLWQTRSATINGFSGILQNGFLGVSNQPRLFDPSYTPSGIFSRLHLADSTDNSVSNYAQQNGYRPWMRNGVTFTDNGDLGYIGQKYTYNDSSDYTSGEQVDYTDMIINWSDNPGTYPRESDPKPRYC